MITRQHAVDIVALVDEFSPPDELAARREQRRLEATARAVAAQHPSAIGWTEPEPAS